jgi:hypothetical protein
LGDHDGSVQIIVVADFSGVLPEIIHELSCSREHPRLLVDLRIGIRAVDAQQLPDIDEAACQIVQRIKLSTSVCNGGDLQQCIA